MRLKRLGTMILVAALTLGQSYGMSLPVRAAETEEGIEAVFSAADESADSVIEAENRAETAAEADAEIAAETEADVEIEAETEAEDEVVEGEALEEELIEDEIETEETDLEELETEEEIVLEEADGEEEKSSELFDVETYGLWVGGIQVTDENKDNLTAAIVDANGADAATGTITFDPDTYTLTFEDATLKNGYSSSSGCCGLITSSSIGALKIAFDGDNYIIAPAYSYSWCTIRCINTNLVFEGADDEAKITVKADMTGGQVNGAIGPNSLTVNRGTVVAETPLESGYNGQNYVPYGLYLNNNSTKPEKLRVNAGIFIAKGWAPIADFYPSNVSENTLVYGSVNADRSDLEEYNFDTNGQFSGGKLLTTYRYVEAVPDPNAKYPLFIAGTQVGPANAADLSGVDGVTVGDDGYFNYDASSNTLNMKGVLITGKDETHGAPWTGIHYWGDGKLTIQADGENTIIDRGSGSSAYGIIVGNESSADLDVVLADTNTSLTVFTGKATEDEAVAVYVGGKLTVSGSGDLNAFAKEASTESIGMMVNDLEVNLDGEGSVEAITSDAAGGYGILAQNEVRLKNGTLVAKADSKKNNTINYGLYLNASLDTEKTLVFVEGGTLEAVAGGSDKGWASAGICGNYDKCKMSITGGKVYAYTTAKGNGTNLALNIGVELGEGIYAGGAKEISESGFVMEDYIDADRAQYKYFEAPYESPAAWGEIPDELKGLFSNKIENVPEGVWYAIWNDGQLDGPFESDDVLSDRIYLAEKLTFNDQIWVFHGSRRLWENRDYTVKYANNLNAAEATAAKAPSVTITGKGSYSSAVTFKFRIKPVSIDFANFTSLKTVTVAPGAKLSTVKPTIAYFDSKLTVNKDYTLKYFKVEGENETEVAATTAVGKKEEYRIRVYAKDGGNFKKELKDYVTVIGLDSKDTSLTAISKVKVTVPKAANLPYDKDGYNTVELFDNRDGKTPKITVTYKNEQLKYDTDFVVNDIDILYAGKTTVHLHGIGAFVGEKVVTIEIGGIPASKVKIACMATTVEYSGRALTDSDIDKLYKKDSTGFEHVTLYTVVGGKKEPLSYGDDYYVELSSSGAVGKMVVEFTLINKYTGTIKKTVTIKARNIKDATVTAGDAEYSKAGAVPDNVIVTLDDGATVLREGIDYTLSYKNNTKAVEKSGKKTDPTVVVKGIGNYSGNASGYYTINKSDIRQHVGLDIADKVFKDKKDYYKSVPKIMDGGKAIAIGKNKDIEAKPASYKYHTVVGDQLVEIPEGTVVPASTLIVVTAEVECGENSSYQKGSYTIMGTYKIFANGNNISKAKVALKNPDVQFDNGKAVDIYPDDLIVTLNGKTLTPGTDYGVVGSPKNNRFLGTATVTIRGSGDFGGTRKFTFKIKAKNIKK